MSDINEVIKNKKTNINPIWIMRQAGRYLPEFRDIRKKNRSTNIFITDRTPEVVSL